MHSFLRAAILLALPLFATACATSRSLSLEAAEADPWEKNNRRVYAFNRNLDRYVLSPAANGYRAVVPQPGRRAIGNAYNTYGQPQNFLNFILQGKVKRAFETLDRFLINATLGVGGLVDVASEIGRPDRQTDFGQTFSQWGFAAGPYVVLPIFGPSTLRDGLASPLDLVVDPADFVRNAALSPSLWWRGGQLGLRFVDLRSRLKDRGADGLLASSLDEYATVRSAWLQSRRAQLYYGNPPLTADELEDYGEEAPEAAPIAAVDATTTETPAVSPAETPLEPGPDAAQ
jgi:phospholipid-binding lipoprotein MlaA